MSLRIFSFTVLAGLLVVSTGCGLLPKQDADAQSQPPKAEQGGGATPVDVGVARTGSLAEELEYAGTTAPVREVSLRPQIEGKLLSLNVNVGDSVEQGQPIARLDNALQASAVAQAEAELATSKSEVARAQTEVSNARTRVEEARLLLQQAQADADRLAPLAREGAISQQSAQQEQTSARAAEQVLRSAEAQVTTQQQAVAAAQGQVVAQQALVDQARERLSYAAVSAPISGIVTQRITEPGNLVQPGGEIVRIGDFSSVKIAVEVSELELSNIRVGQSVKVRLDAFPDEELTGDISLISPAADPTSRLVPVEVVIPNSNGRIGSGLLARVNFATRQVDRVVVPDAALQAGGRQGGKGAGGQASKGAGEQASKGAGEQASKGEGERGSRGANAKSSQGVVFIVKGEGEKATVEARSVQTDERANGQVEIVSGLQPGERYVTRSGKPLKDGDSVRFSVLSEK
ncbi:MAG: efflux RND transporter periplasmic adaptor subunit [Microcoleus vaginatus WJT46-NPBG5]|nr:efflux RND transporter periplasmic adaptor subunit [Microcoleus vaginatus WJT46-NPBG5]